MDVIEVGNNGYGALAAIKFVLHARFGLGAIGRDTDVLHGLGHVLLGLGTSVSDEAGELLVGGLAHWQTSAGGCFEALEDFGVSSVDRFAR